METLESNSSPREIGSEVIIIPLFEIKTLQEPRTRKNGRQNITSCRYRRHQLTTSRLARVAYIAMNPATSWARLRIQ